MQGPTSVHAACKGVEFTCLHGNHPKGGKTLTVPDLSVISGPWRQSLNTTMQRRQDSETKHIHTPLENMTLFFHS